MKIVLVGGCFDVLHPGHVVFLQKAKKEGDILVVLLESDKKVRKLKGRGRPIHTQKERALILSALSVVDRVILLPYFEKDEQYNALIEKIKPDVIAATEGDDFYQRRIARKLGIKLKIVTKKIGNYSSSRVLQGTVQ